MAWAALLRSSRFRTEKVIFPVTAHIFFKPLHFSTVCKSKHFDFSLPLPPPVAKKMPFTAEVHGVTSQDPYHWMSNTNDPDFINYLHKENAYADAFMQDTRQLQRTLYNEMVSRMPGKISTPPESWGPWLYYQYIPEGKEYPVLCRKRDTRSKGWIASILNPMRGGFWREQVLLDWNEIAEKYGYVHVGTCRVSPDHNFLAYTLDTNGAEQFLLQIKDLRSESILPACNVEGVVSLAWAQDGHTLFYTLCDQNQRPYRVVCRKLESDSVNDVLIFTESDPSYCVDITSTKDGKFITVNSNSRTSSEEGTWHASTFFVHVIDATNPQAQLQKFCERVCGVQYFLEHHEGFFYVLTNAPSSDNEFSHSGYYLARCHVEQTKSSSLQNIISPSKNTCLQDMDIFHGHLVLFLNKEGYPAICSIELPIDVNYEKQMDLDDLNPWFFPLPINMCTVVPGSNHDFMNSVYRVVLSSPVMPDVIADYDMLRKTFSIVHQEEVPDTLTSNVQDHSMKDSLWENKRHVQDNVTQEWKDITQKYACEEKEVISHDGVRIPLTILFSPKAHQKGQSPGLVQVYGAYGEVLDKSWSSDRLSLLDCGWLFAFADVRGGGRSDPSWHRSGAGLNKLNSVYDFISCSEYLIKEGLVHESHLGALGISAGCLVVGAAINLQPELFRAAILKVPFLDVCNTLLDSSLPLTLLDYEEFGNPQTESYFKYILSYSPYDNIPQGVCCPSMLVSASFNDSRVGVWEAAKWVAKIRDTACSRCSRSVILQTNMNGGHFREGGRYAQSVETSYEYAFLMKAMGTTGNKT